MKVVVKYNDNHIEYLHDVEAVYFEDQSITIQDKEEGCKECLLP